LPRASNSLATKIHLTSCNKGRERAELYCSLLPGQTIIGNPMITGQLSGKDSKSQKHKSFEEEFDEFFGEYFDHI
jgi:hypothetical protein